MYLAVSMNRQQLVDDSEDIGNRQEPIVEELFNPDRTVLHSFSEKTNDKNANQHKAPKHQKQTKPVL